MQSVPRPEYPRPQFVRDAYLNLNGEWMFEIDQPMTGESRGLIAQNTLKDRILVPFCPESALSGIHHKDFMRCVWYKRTFTLPDAARGKRVFLNLGAADYRTTAYLNGVELGRHEGGYTSFSFELTKALKTGENLLTLRCEDDTRDGLQPTGKQSGRYASYGCFYTRTTGIWQTVWLEWMNDSFIRRVFLTPDAQNARVTIRAELENGVGCTLRAAARFAGGREDALEARCAPGFVEMTLPLGEAHLWDVGQPNLYDLDLTLLKDGHAVDALKSYFGLRTVGFDGMRFLLNGRPVFQRLVLDQGFYPDGIYTAPNDEALKRDIELSMAMGFNGARLHQKVFEARYLYWADHMGYLCWGEMANWGLDHGEDAALAAFLKEWLEAVERDYSAPSIIGWCPFNETWDENGRRQKDDVLKMTYRVTKALDKTRPVIDTSGNYHTESDIHDVHDYTQDVAEFTARYGRGTKPIYERFPDRQNRKDGQPVFVSEYGGIRWAKEQEGWGYGEAPKSKEEFLARYQGLTDALLSNPDHFGFCYTQLTDVEQEVNGLYDYNRNPKFPPEVIRAINARKAAIEE